MLSADNCSLLNRDNWDLVSPAITSGLSAAITLGAQSRTYFGLIPEICSDVNDVVKEATWLLDSAATCFCDRDEIWLGLSLPRLLTLRLASANADRCTICVGSNSTI